MHLPVPAKWNTQIERLAFPRFASIMSPLLIHDCRHTNRAKTHVMTNGSGCKNWGMNHTKPSL